MKRERKIIYGVILGVISVLLLLTVYLLIYFWNMRDISINKEYINVKEDSYIDYTIKLKDNNYITDSSKVTTYVTDMIDYINIYYDYKTNFSDKVSGKVLVSISGVLVGNSKEDNSTVLYNEFLKPEDVNYKVEGGLISLGDSYKLDFNNVNKIFESFKEINKKDLDGYIKYDVTITYEVYSELVKQMVTKKTKLTLDMPLGGTTKIVASEDTKDSEQVIFAKMTDKQKPLYLAICLELFGAAVLFIILILMIINQMKKTVSRYEKELDKLLNKYKRRIVTLKRVPDLSNKTVVLVKNFEDLNNVSKIKNINFVEMIENKLSIFFINDNDITYVYNFDSRKVR